MAHNAEPMDIDDESVFDNKENTYQHSNVLPRTPCTEKGYEELDVSELNMKLRYSITPASSPMSKSMSHCLDNRNNNSADDSLSNTVINEYENNLTRSLNSTLNKTEVKLSKVLPLQALPKDIVDNNRSSILRPLDTATANDITITVSNDNEIDNLSCASSSSSVIHTPEATTPTKEIPKHDGGSPIMRGLKSVLSMFRSSQSPIPPGEEDPKTANPADVPLTESKLRAVASTPKNENNKEKSLSRRNSPHKESIVFNEDLEKELQWNDDSTIVFSTEKIPIHKLFFQDKPSKSAILNENVKYEDADSTVEYMDVSYNDLSVKDRTLNGTINKSRVNELAESDGEFVDCETTFTQGEAESKTEDIDPLKISNSHIPTAPEKLQVDIATTNEPFTLDTTKDIINSIDASNTFVEANADEVKGRELDYSAIDIVNQLSDLINETSAANAIENKNSVILDNHQTLTVSDVQFQSHIQPDLLQNQVTSPMNSAIDPTVTVSEQVSVNNKALVHTSDMVCDTIAGHLKPADPKICLPPVESHAVTTHEVDPQSTDKIVIIKATEKTNDNSVEYPSPLDIPLPNDDDINEINDNLVENVVCAELKDVQSASSQNVLMAALNKSIEQVEAQNNAIACPLNLLSSDASLLNAKTENTNNITHEAITVVFDPVQTPVIEKPDTSVGNATSKVDLINEAVDKSTTVFTPDVPHVLIESTVEDNIKVDLPSPSLSPSEILLPGMDDHKPIETYNLAFDAATVSYKAFEQQSNENPDIISIVNSTANIDSIIETVIIKTAEVVSEEVKAPETTAVDTTPINLDKSQSEQMELSFVGSNNDKLSEIIAMDICMVDASIKTEDSLNQKPRHEEFQSFGIIPDIGSNMLETNTDIINTEQKTEVFKVEPESRATTNKETILDSSSVTTKDLTDTTKSAESLNENTDVTANLTITTADHHETPSSDSPSENNITSYYREGNIANNVPEIVGDLHVKSTIATLLLNEQDCSILPTSAVSDENRACDTTVNKESSRKVEITSKFEEKMDEEIVLSESTSPFISMSAEGEFDPESKKEEFEKNESPFSTKSKVAQSPPISPKIVSKGYNFNFDDIDNINAFATKTKIRMSPPPGVSPNTSLITEDMNRTISVVEPVKTNKDTNRRKSMPERKKPLKAKRHSNSSIDSTENSAYKIKTCKNNDLRNTPKSELPQESIAQFSQPDNKTDTNTAVSVTHNISNDKVDVTAPSEISTCEDISKDLEAMPSEVNKCLANVQGKLEAIPSEITTYEEPLHKESGVTPSEGDIVDDNTIKNETNIEQNSGPKVIEDVVTASSSEQSTYFSAGASSTELTDSKNVFNLPELDGFNPFATKSKIRQTPPRDIDTDNPFVTRSNVKSSPDSSLVITQKDCNSTVTFDNDNNLSTGSGSSKTSEEKDVTVKEVHTEDEDTLEGPFLDADDIDNGDKIPEFTDNKLDVVDFDNLKQQDNDEAAEMFIDAEAFEFLMNKNKTDEVAYSGKESLFLKFDPLFARRVTSEGVAAALNDIKRKQSTPKKATKPIPPKEVELLSFEKPVAGPSELNKTSERSNVIEEKTEDMNVTVSKPMMAVTPAVNPVVTPRKSLTPNRSNRLSMTFTSPAMAVIDRLLSLSGNSPSAGLDTTVTHADRSYSEADQALTQLRELLAEKEINVYNLRCETKELKDRLSTLETQMKALEAESAERLKKVNELNENLAEKTKMNRNMAAVVEEYERTIASLISETEQDKIRFAEERNQLIRDRDEQTAHLSSMEVSFNDLHSKYEKSKQIIIGYKNNEEAYKKSLLEFEENLAKMHTNYELLKQHATSKLNHANQELEKINKSHEAEVLKFNAMIKRKELHITSLEESLAQKTKANEELTAICDELINKVG